MSRHCHHICQWVWREVLIRSHKPNRGRRKCRCVMHSDSITWVHRYHCSPDKPAWRHTQALVSVPMELHHESDLLLTSIDIPQQLLQCSACGREFSQSSSFSIHAGSCRPSKKRMITALGSAKESYLRKKARFNPPSVEQAPHQPHDNADYIPAAIIDEIEVRIIITGLLI